MTKQNFDIDNIRVAAPCSVGWESMTRSERARLCHSCRLNVYNIAEMTKLEVENLLLDNEERVCIRLYRRADGTILTKDCPVGPRSYRKKVRRLASAAFAAILGMCSISFGQKKDVKPVDASKIKIARVVSQNQENIIKGRIFDPSGAVIPNATLEIYKKNNKDSILLPIKTKLIQSEYSNKMGEYFLWEKAERGLLKKRRKSLCRA